MPGTQSTVFAVLGFLLGLAAVVDAAAVVVALPVALLGLARAAVSMMTWRPGTPWSADHGEPAVRLWLVRTRTLLSGSSPPAPSLTRDEILAVVGLWGSLLDIALNILGLLLAIR